MIIHNFFRVLLCIALQSISTSTSNAYTFNGNDAFSLSTYQKIRAEETSKSLDASRFHFQILFVDNDNFHGRIAEGMLARVAEYNDALFTLFPASATIDSSPNAPRDAAAPDAAVVVCESLGLCSTRSNALGTSFSMEYLDEYDLIVALDDDIQSLILRSLPPDSGYASKCRLLSEFLSIDFCTIRSQVNKTDDRILFDMLEPELLERAKPIYEQIRDSSSNLFHESVNTREKGIYEPRVVLSKDGAAVPNKNGWPMVEAAIIIASAGLTRFCLDTMDAQFETALQVLLDQNFYRPEHLQYTLENADDQLCRSSFSVTGYFSPKQRKERIKQHLVALREKLL